MSDQTVHPPVFDGHNDALLRLWSGGFAGGFFALFPPDPNRAGFDMAAFSNPPYDIPLPAPLDAGTALAAITGQTADSGY